MSNRTPLPWKAHKAANDGWALVMSGGAHGFIVANVNIESCPSIASRGLPVVMPAENNAEFIVRACNAHEDLLAAAQNAVNVLAALATGQLKEVTPDSPAIAQLRNAIAKAKGN